MSTGSGTGAVQFGEPPASMWRRGAGRGKSVTDAPAQGQSATRRHVTVRHVRAAWSGALVTGQLPSLKVQQARIHARAAEWQQPVLKYSSLAWGYFHLAVIHAPLTVVWWATETRTRLVFAGLLAYLAWKFG